MGFTYRRRRRVRLAMAGLFAVAALGCAKKEAEQPVDQTAASLSEFSRRVDEYVALRNRASQQVGPLDQTKSQLEIAARADLLAQAILAERAGAKPGDIFTAEAATVIATLIKQEYSRRPDSTRETRQDQQEELPDFIPQINVKYPTTYPLATFPATLLPLLPKLPDQVEYRIVQNYLILRDVEANLIIDFMPRAVPEGGN